MIEIPKTQLSIDKCEWLGGKMREFVIQLTPGSPLLPNETKNDDSEIEVSIPEPMFSRANCTYICILS